MSDPLRTSRMRTEYAVTRCDKSRMAKVSFNPGTALWVDRATAPVWNAFSAVMKSHDYRFEESAGGTFVCRQIAGTSNFSLHAYGLALDLNPSRNPFKIPLRTDQPRAFRRDLEKIITRSGRQVFQWGGRWATPDAMHWQVGALRSELRTGIIAPVVVEPEGRSGSPGVLRTGDRGERVRDIQEVLVNLGYRLQRFGADGDFGDETEEAVMAFQSDVQIEPDGIWGPVTEDYATGVCQSGDEGPAVEAVQKILVLAGYELPHFGADGDYGDETMDAVRSLQRDAGIAEDGVFGPVSRRAALDTIRRT